MVTANQPTVPEPPTRLVEAAGQPLIPGLGVAQASITSVTVSHSWQGEFPPPDAAERFERILPGFLERSLAMAERLQQAQIESASEARRLLQSDTRRAHYLGAGISIIALICAAVVAALGNTVAAVALVGVPVMAVVRAFIDRPKH